MHLHGAMRGLGAEVARPRRLSNYRVVLRLMAYARPRSLAGFSAVAMLAYSGTLVAHPWLIRRAVDSVVGTPDTSALTIAAVLVGVNALAGYGANYLHLTTLARVGQNLLVGLRTGTFNHMQALPMSYFDRTEVGANMSRVQNDVQQLQDFLAIFVPALGHLLALGGFMVAMLLMKWELALISFTVIPFLFLAMVMWQRYAWPVFMQIRRNLATVNAALQENISGVRVVQALNRQADNLGEFDRKNSLYLGTSLRASRLSAALNPSVEVLNAAATGLVIIFGGIMVLNNELEVGVLVAFALYIQQFFQPIRTLTMQYSQLQRAVASGQHIFEVLDLKPEIADKPGALRLPPLKGEVRFDHVGFSYRGGEPVLRDINLLVRPGENVALVGPTGAGKTTLAALLSRLYDVNEGSVSVDGHDVRDVERVSLTRQVGVVHQEPYLFSGGTVADNIRYCHPDATDREVMTAASAVGAHELILRLERGYDTPVEERGANLSAGQRQLVAMARAMLADPRILVLDEATATVDSRTELQVQQALNAVLSGRTALIIAHRLSTVRSADRIVVLDQGRIVEEGTHGELVALGGLYSRLYAAGQGV